MEHIGNHLSTAYSTLLQQAKSGQGVFASDGVWKRLRVTWWKRPWYSWSKPNDGIILATFPLHAAVTPQTILADPVLGSTYQELLSVGMLQPSSQPLLDCVGF